MQQLFEAFNAVMAAVYGGFGQGRVLVVGDVMLDRYLWGKVTRISPEAPVPVVKLIRQSDTPGGAANVGLNLRGLGLQAAVAGFIGNDAEGRRLIEILERAGIDTGALIPLDDRPTTSKTRVIGEHQQMLRLDLEEVGPLPVTASEALIGAVRSRLQEKPAAVILSDYAKGTLAADLCARLIATARHERVPILVDPKDSDFRKYAGATALSPNRSELAAATGTQGQDLDALLTAGEHLRSALELEFLVVTLSEQGMTLLNGGPPQNIPAAAREVYDVSGAGDTVIATLAAGLAARLPLLDCLHLANLAAGVVIGKVGTVPIETQELLAALSAEQALWQSDKVCTLETVLKRAGQWRALGERIVFTNGCFDLLHAGHVTYLERARREGHRLIVGLNTDRSVRALKGEGRPVIHQDDRARVLAALASVDAVVLFDEDTPIDLIRALRPDVLAKGSDYREDQVVGGAEVKRWGGKVVLVPLVSDRSSTSIVERLRGATGSSPNPSP